MQNITNLMLINYQVISDSIFCFPFWVCFKQCLYIKFKSFLLRHLSKLFPGVPLQNDKRYKDHHINSHDSGQFPLLDAPTGNHDSCIVHLKLDSI